MNKKLCLVTGVGEGTGAAIARRFARENYLVAMLARDAKRLQSYQQALPGSHAFPCDIGDLDSLGATLEEVRRLLGTPDVIVHNAVRATFDSV